MTHRRWSYLKSAVRVIGFLTLILAECLGIMEEKDE